MKKVGKNEACPCGSGKKYRDCCWNKGFRLVRDSEGVIHKQIPLSTSEMKRALGMKTKEIQEMFRAGSEEVEGRFRKRHGRNPMYVILP